jgi:hypothetical protein
MPVSTVHNSRCPSNINSTSGSIDGASGEKRNRKARKGEIGGVTGTAAGDDEGETAGSACIEMRGKGRAMDKLGGRIIRAGA